MVIIKVPKAGAVVINASILNTTKKSFSLAVALYLIILIAGISYFRRLVLLLYVLSLLCYIPLRQNLKKLPFKGGRRWTPAKLFLIVLCIFSFINDAISPWDIELICKTYHKLIINVTRHTRLKPENFPITFVDERETENRDGFKCLRNQDNWPF